MPTARTDERRSFRVMLDKLRQDFGLPFRLCRRTVRRSGLRWTLRSRLVLLPWTRVLVSSPLDPTSLFCMIAKSLFVTNCVRFVWPDVPFPEFFLTN